MIDYKELDIVDTVSSMIDAGNSYSFRIIT